ncbi:hypothetical protein BO94DRAFT_428708, partial [Aspergillus sclerotioniger CBS 115572]
ELKDLVERRIRPWMQRCCAEHVECQQAEKETSGQLPTRLIDLGPSATSPIKVIETSAQREITDRIEYLILSYCWGECNDTAKTTRFNLHHRLDSLEVDKFPATIRDAISLTRALEIRYIWIDAICIIQPSDDGYYDDLRREGTKMASYYTNAMCCISVSSSPDSSHSFLTERRLMRQSWHPKLASREPEITREVLGSKWLEFVEYYATTDLSFPSDRLDAINGIVRYLSERHQDQYFGGIFSSCPEKGLLW